MKYKKIPKEHIKICTDRLTRFKPVCEKYNRVFLDIVNKFLISSSDNVDFEEKNTENIDKLCTVVCEIFNSSVPFEHDSFISNILLDEEEKNFILNDVERKFLNAKLNLTGALRYISDDENLPKNLKRLSVLLEHREINTDILRQENSFLYPIKKVILTEGATEEILLSEFAKKIGYDFNKEGVLIIGAGGKNQVARKYYKMVDEIRLPVFILLDFDANETKELIMPKLRTQDEIHVIKSGEFEDILSLDLIINSINANFSNNLHCCAADFSPEIKMTKNLSILFKNKGFGEYKKAVFAKMVKNFMENSCGSVLNVTSEIKEIVKKIELL